MKCYIILCLFLATISFSRAGEDQESLPLKEQLEKLLSEKQDMAALRLALSKPKEARTFLDQYKGSNSRSEYIGWLIQSELLLLEKKDDEALKLLKMFIAKIEKVGSQKTWKDGVIPANYYLSNRVCYTPNGGRENNLILQRLRQFKEHELAENEYQRILDTRGIQIYTNFEFVIEFCNYLRSRNKSARANQLLLSELDGLGLNAIFMASSNDRCYRGCLNSKPRMQVEQFIKICYGYFKLDHKQDELFEHLAQSKSKSALVIRAKIQAQLGHHDKALELAIKHAHAVQSSPSNLVYRLGMTYHYFAKYDEAIVELEKFIKLNSHQKEKPGKANFNRVNSRFDGYSVNVALQECYLATKNTKKLIQAKLTAILGTQMGQVYSGLERVKAFAIKSNYEDLYKEWAAHALEEKGTNILLKAYISYVNGDVPRTLDYSRNAALQGVIYDYSRWGEIYTKLGKRKEWITILRELHQKAKEDSSLMAQRRLIRCLGDEATDAEVILFYENFLASNESFREERSNGYLASEFTGRGHVFNRLLRLYYRNQMVDEFDALALKIVNMKKFEPQTYINANDSEAALSYYISKSSNDKIQVLKKHLNPEKWKRTHKLVDWVLAGGVKQDLLNKPKGDLIKTNAFSVIASDQNVRDIVRNKSRFFTSHPYGISVYDHSGTHQKRIFIPNIPHHLAANEKYLWIGTAEGVFQLNLESWELSRLALREKITDYERELSLDVTALAINNDHLWIGCANNIRKYNTVNKTIQIYTNVELGYRAGGSGDWSRFMFQKREQSSDVIWVTGYDGATRRYDPETDSWMKTLPLIGIKQNKVWLSKRVNQRLNDRPALFDESNLTAKPCKISKNSSAPSDWGKSLEELHIAGELNQQPVFYSTRGGSAYYLYLPESHELKPLAKNWNVNSMNSTFVSTGQYEYRNTTEHSDGAIRTGSATWLRLGDDAVLKGFKYSIDRRAIRTSDIRVLKAEYIGLHLYKDKKYSNRISTSGIYGSCVFDVLETSQGVWVCTNAGLSFITKEGSLIANYTTEHGLPEGGCTSAVEINGTCFFAFNGDYQKGGLAYLDKSSSRFHRLNDVDGLSCNRVARVEVENQKVKLIYETYSSATDNNQEIGYAATMFDPVKMKLSDRLAPVKITTRKVEEKLSPMPHQLGYKIGEKIVNSQTWVFGTQGIIVPHQSKAKNRIKDVSVRLIGSKQLKLHAQARDIINDEENTLTLRQKLEHPNHFLIVAALNQATGRALPEELAKLADLTPLVIQLLESPYEKVQIAGAEFLFKVKSKASINALLGQANSKNERLKYLAVLTAARYSKKLPLTQLRNYLEPYIYRSSSENHDEILGMLLNRGDLTGKDTITLLLRYPERANNGWGRRSPISYPDFSKTLSNKPELISELLKADDIYQNYGSNRRFMFDLFRKVDKSVLPILYEALESGDRIVAANAALACAAIGEQSSIPKLIKALEIESALTQHSVVVALGELKAKKAIPHLLSIDRILRQNWINRSAYNSFAMNSISHFESQENTIDSVTTKDEFQLPVNKGRQISDSRNRGRETTTNLETIFNALKAIAPEMCQSYFREVIASGSYYRLESAIILLKRAQGNEVKENIQFLNNVTLSDPRDVKLAEQVKLELMQRK